MKKIGEILSLVFLLGAIIGYITLVKVNIFGIFGIIMAVLIMIFIVCGIILKKKGLLRAGMRMLYIEQYIVCILIISKMIEGGNLYVLIPILISSVLSIILTMPKYLEGEYR